MELLDAGLGPAEVARRVGVTRSAVSQWKKRRACKGRESLAAIRHPGPTSKLTDAQTRRLLRKLLKGARAAGFATELWTLSRVAELIRRDFGAKYEPSGVWRLLRRADWSCQKPLQRARERNEAAMAAWRSEDWPRIKKSRAKRPTHRTGR